MQPFRDPDLPAKERIDNLVSLLTLDEKIDCLSTNPSVPRLDVRGSGHVEGLHGLALGGPGRWGREHPVPTTTFPQAIGLAETWDPAAVREVAEVESHEARHAFQCKRWQVGGLVVRAPNADLGRDPRWGRTEECYGEDPYLTGVMAVAFVRGLQGDHPRYWRTAALLKHFFANSNENDRERSSSDFDESLFREYYSVPFRMAIEEGGARAYMAAYNAHHGVPCTTHPILREVTVDEWKQDGIISTDGGAFRLLVTAHRFYPDLYRAAAAALRAGITQFLDDYRDGVRGALERGYVTEREIDEAIGRNFTVMIRLGLLDPPERVPYSAIGESEEDPWQSEAHRAAVVRVTQKSIVLLKNEGALLPLDKDAVRSVAIIGPLADRVLVDWYSGTPPYAISPSDGIREKLASARSSEARERTQNMNASARVTVRQVTNNDDSDAVRVARESEVCIVCVGNHPTGDAGWAEVTRRSYGREAVDRQSLELEDEELVKRVWAANPRTVVVLISSFPYAIVWTQENVPAIVHCTHNSQELGHALADVLFGDYNPGGRLVQTWPKSIEALPPMMDYDIRHGRTYMYFEGEPLYPFGYGLSYTTFRYHALRVSADSIWIGSGAADGSIVVSVEVTNTGARAGDEVVQMYAGRPGSHADMPRGPRSPTPPRKRLVGFKRVRLGPGETGTVEMPLAARSLAHWDAAGRSFSVEKGDVEITLGGSSARIELRRKIVVR